ncbi:hypothetical protein MVEN_00097500 [Mycena venus]|uniref:Uncharacterized protein n=1 Tax=Mycena venus TaxID=2733690 RepID=A0A8H7DGL2_9AGAR|nr:hypothetical protein MVEN_00097500 [Mycena venus]
MFFKQCWLFGVDGQALKCRSFPGPRPAILCCRVFHPPSSPLPLRLLPLPIASPTLDLLLGYTLPPTSTSRLSPIYVFAEADSKTKRLPTQSPVLSPSCLIPFPVYSIPFTRFDAVAFATPYTMHALMPPRRKSVE